jgi:predicted transposase YbfD/YdcC
VAWPGVVGDMARQTQAQQIARENEQHALDFFAKILAEVPDPRRRQGLRYPLGTVIVVALMATVCGADDAEAMEAWGKAHEDWLAGFLEVPHGTPTQDVFLAVFAAMDPEAFSAVFRAWVSLLTVRLAPGRHIAIDGKTSRRSADAANGQVAIHTVSAWMSDAGLVIGQLKTGEKTNEITAIPKLLDLLDISGATITSDAMGCQTTIAGTIVGKDGDYLLAVKENQPTLHQDIARTFAEAADERVRPLDKLPRPITETVTETDKGHGRVEQRTVEVCRDLSWLTTAERWPKLSFVVRVTRERTVLLSGKTSTETAFYIGSDADAAGTTISGLIRRHWTIENQLHWVLDIGFREDEARHRARNTGQNMTTLRHFALNLVKQDKTRRVGVANSRKRAGWDKAYLITLLTGGASAKT